MNNPLATEPAMLTEQEAEIWNAAIDYYRTDEDIFAVVSQISDLAQKAFAELMIEARKHLEYADRIACEGLIYAKRTLIEYASRFASI